MKMESTSTFEKSGAKHYSTFSPPYPPYPPLRKGGITLKDLICILYNETISNTHTLFTFDECECFDKYFFI